MGLDIPDLIGQAVDQMTTYIERGQRREADAVERAVAYLDAAIVGTSALGQTAQRLHNAAAVFDPTAETRESDAQQLLERVNEYLYTNVLTTELDGVVSGLRQISDELDQSPGRRVHLPRTKRRRSEVVAELRGAINEVVSLLDEISGLTRHLAAGTGIGAVTLRKIEKVISSGSWRDQPTEARESLRQAADDFRTSDENTRWQQLVPRFHELEQALLNAFPAP